MCQIFHESSPCKSGLPRLPTSRGAVGGTVLLGVAASVLVSAACLLFLSPILRFMNISDDLLPQARAYVSVILSGLLAATLYNICAAILRAIGDSFTPLIFLIISTVLNIFLDYTLILHFEMGVAGAALATVISQALSALYLRAPRFCPQKVASVVPSTEKGSIKMEVIFLAAVSLLSEKILPYQKSSAGSFFPPVSPWAL